MSIGMRRTGLDASATLYQLDDIREENDARRKRTLRKNRVFKLVEVIAWILGFLWTALLLSSLLPKAGR